LQFLGLYRAEGKFQTSTEVNTCLAKQAPSANADSGIQRKGMRPAVVPPAFPLTPLERTVEDLPSNYHARSTVRGHRRFSGWLNAMMTAAYGNERPLLAPQHVITDSKGRVIIADPKVPAIHVLDGANSFRIIGGLHRRLQNPNGVAVDAQDNIYVADSSLGLVLVYDPLGRYLRSIGQLEEQESMLHQPAGIAINRERGRLYVVDLMRERLFVFSLAGQSLYRIGVRGEEEGSVTFDDPTDVALVGDSLVVLDQRGARVQILDFAGHLRSRFDVALVDPAHPRERGLAADRHHHVFISNLNSASIRVFDEQGNTIGTLSEHDPGLADLKSPEGLWMDSSSRIFVTDSTGQQVQVFQVEETENESSK
jgi:sugar lactone lactonase YvrE